MPNKTVEQGWQPKRGDWCSLAWERGHDDRLRSYLDGSPPRFQVVSVEPRDGEAPLLMVRAVWPNPPWLTYDASWFEAYPGPVPWRSRWLGWLVILRRLVARPVWWVAGRLDPYGHKDER